MINLKNFPLFFSGLTKSFTLDAGRYRLAISNGMSPDLWPDCAAKEIALDFHQKAQSKGVEYAALYTAKKVDSLPDFEIPDAINELICLYNEYKAYGHSVNLAKGILTNPQRTNELIESFKASSGNQVKVHHVQNEIDQYVATHLRDVQTKKELVVKIPGWDLLSTEIDGFNPSRVILLAAQTGVGKTNISLNLALSASKKMPVLYFNMEMNKEDIYQRIMQMSGGITKYEWRNGANSRLSDKASKAVNSLYRQEGFFITDGRALSIEEICSTIFLRAEKDKVKFVVVDYDQKIRTKYKMDEWQALQKAIEELEEVAKATQTCVFILCQADENNLPKASKRIIQSSSVLLSFVKDLDGYYIESHKSRNGGKFRLGVDFDYETLTISEKSIIPNIPQRQIKDLKDLR